MGTGNRGRTRAGGIIARGIALAMALAAPLLTHALTPAISAGNHHSVALRTDGTVRTWGDDSSGELGLGRTLAASTPAIVRGLSNVAAVASGNSHVVALLRDGTLWAWGRNNVGQLGDGTTTNRSTPAPVQGIDHVIAIAAGTDHTLALRADGTVWSWGVDYHGELGYDDSLLVPAQVPRLSNIVAVAAGDGFSLSLGGDGVVWGWGENDRGQLGDGTFAEAYTGRSDARPVTALANVVGIAAGGGHAIAVTNAGTVYTWGDGALGTGNDDPRNVPRAVPGVSNVKAVAAGDDHALALGVDGSVQAWGGGYEGQLGDGNNTPSLVPVRVSSLNATNAISAAVFFSIARRDDGSVWAWGDNRFGQMGDGTTQQAAVPQRIASLPQVASIAAGGSHAFAVTGDGLVYAWGANDFGELGDGVRPLRSTPAVVPGVSSIVAIAGGGTHTIALKSDGSMLAWGANWAGQLGDGSGDAHSSAVAVSGPGSVVQVGAGYYYSAALRSDGTVWTWGEGYSGPLGQGNEDSLFVPTQVPGLPVIRAIAAGYSHMLALASDGTVRAWGGNGTGELGDGTTIDRDSPITVSGLSGVAALAAGAEHSLALKADGTVWAWGQNYSGELGDGSSNNSRSLPAPVPGLTSVVAIAAGDSFSLALRSDGTVWAWGANWSSQIGDGSGYEQDRPVPVALPGRMAAISAGGTGGLALRADGTVWAWGSNVDGRLGDGTFVTRDKPVVVLREDGAGNLDTNDWFLDLDPAQPKSIPADRVPVFLVVTTSASGAVTAQLRFRGQDIGTQGNVYAFALAPASQVSNAQAGKKAQLGTYARGAPKDTPVPCVLAQLGASGQLVGTSASSLQAYLSGVLSAQGQAVTLLNSQSSNIAGATFYVGYGSDPASMITAGTNRSVVTVPGAVTCQPQAPQTGWWWNPAEPGRGFSIEEAGGHIFFAAFGYETSGRSTWNVASGATSLDGSLFTGSLLDVAGGQTLGGAYPGFPRVATNGPITLAFNDASHGTMIWPGGSVPIERQPFTPTSLGAPPLPTQPENGWWWNPSESGRGFFLEWQGDLLDIAGYMYDDAGNPVWYIGVYQTSDPRIVSGNWWSYANGQSEYGTYKPAVQTSNTVAPVTITFSAPDTAVMTLPNGRTTTLTRQRF